MHYKVIFLILSSEDKDIYIEMKKLSKLYFNLFNDIKYFFLEYKPDIADDIIEIDNHLYLHGEESINPGMYNKTIKSMKYINNNYSYDYIIRTNLSTIWHMNNLYNLLNNLPKNNFAGGFIPQGFITGTGLIISKDVARFLVNNQDNDIDIHEDVRRRRDQGTSDKARDFSKILSGLASMKVASIVYASCPHIQYQSTITYNTN